MKPTLALKPTDYVLQSLLVNYANGTPISCDQYNFLYRHEKALTGQHYTDIKRYYLKDYYLKHAAESHSFLLPHEKLNAAGIQELKQRIHLLLQDNKSSIQFKMKPEQFLQLRALTVEELILYHGNQFLTGAPFYPSGVPHTLFFQWGNLFGVAKYIVLAEEKALNSNLMIHFELMHERNLDECVATYQHDHQLAPQPTYQSRFTTPTLTLSRNKDKSDER